MAPHFYCLVSRLHFVPVAQGGGLYCHFCLILNSWSNIQSFHQSIPTTFPPISKSIRPIEVLLYRLHIGPPRAISIFEISLYWAKSSLIAYPRRLPLHHPNPMKITNLLTIHHLPWWQRCCAKTRSWCLAVSHKLFFVFSKFLFRWRQIQIFHFRASSLRSTPFIDSHTAPLPNHSSHTSSQLYHHPNPMILTHLYI